jgi:hypothetical protein
VGFPIDFKEVIMNPIEVYELIGTIANLAVKNGNGKLRLKDLAAILVILDFESHEWDHYKSRTDDLIKKAHDHFVKNGPATTADNIKATFIKADGKPLIP